MLYGWQPALPLLLYSLAKVENSIQPNQCVEKLAQTLISIQVEAYDTTLARKYQQKSKDNETKAPLNVFKKGNEVVYCEAHGFDQTHKLSALWMGPCVVLKKNSDYSYVILLPNSHVLNRVHSKYFWPYKW